MLPFYGKAHVAYIPDGYITGLSKMARVVECFARRLQVQERLTVQIRDCIQEALQPAGSGRRDRSQPHVHADARHRKAAVGDDHLGLHGHLPARPPHARGVHGADPVAPRRRSGRDAKPLRPDAPCLNAIRPESFSFRGGFIARRRASRFPRFGDPAIRRRTPADQST